MIDKLLPLIKEHFDEEHWTITETAKSYYRYDSHGKVSGQKVIESIHIESIYYEFNEIHISYDTYEDKLWLGGQDIPYETFCLIHDIIEEYQHSNKVIRCEKCNAIIDTTNREYYTGIEYFCSACGNSGFIRKEDIWTTKE